MTQLVTLNTSALLTALQSVALQPQTVYDVRGTSADGMAAAATIATNSDGQLQSLMRRSHGPVWTYTTDNGSLAIESQSPRTIKSAITPISDDTDVASTRTLQDTITPVFLLNVSTPHILRATAVTPSGDYAEALVSVVDQQVKRVANLHSPLFGFAREGRNLAIRKQTATSPSVRVVIFHEDTHRQTLLPNTLYDVHAVDAAGEFAAAIVHTDAAGNPRDVINIIAPLFSLSIDSAGEIVTSDSRPAAISVVSPATTRLNNDQWAAVNNFSDPFEVAPGATIAISTFIRNYSDDDPLQTGILTASGYNQPAAGDITVTRTHIEVNEITDPVTFEVQPLSVFPRSVDPADLPDFALPSLESRGIPFTAAPGADGHGTDRTARENRPIVAVHDAATYNAAQVSTGAEVIFFGGGVFEHDFRINHASNVRVWGQTAPAPVTFLATATSEPNQGFAIGQQFMLAGVTDTVLMHMSIRHTPEDIAVNTTRDGWSIQYSTRVVMKNISTSWASDEGSEITRNPNVVSETSSDCTIWECQFSDPMIAPVSGTQSGNSLISYADDITIVHSLFSNGQQRNAAIVEAQGVDYRYNLVYNHRRGVAVEDRGRGTSANVQDSLFIEGPDSNVADGRTPANGSRYDVQPFRNTAFGLNQAEAYMAGNVRIDADGNVAAPLENPTNGATVRTTPIDAPTVTAPDALPADDHVAFEEQLLARAGHRLPYQDPVTTAQKEDVANRTGVRIRNVADVQTDHTAITPYVNTGPHSIFSATAVDKILADVKRQVYPKMTKTDAEWDQYNMNTEPPLNGGQYSDWEVLIVDTFGY